MVDEGLVWIDRSEDLSEVMFDGAWLEDALAWHCSLLPELRWILSAWGNSIVVKSQCDLGLFKASLVLYFCCSQREEGLVCLFVC